ncbi:MAG TPA: BadF/BadG/BcrA/BcrD ATPase family protein [Nocardioides sp.]|jgi:N-acetylglucosamine kinase-like BadF-type ATPase|nr:BadF/BadG/BcrA/BcrD ATPase family protein [Nocardioides sp.]
MDDHEKHAAVLAIDAGNSKTDVAIIAEDGTVLGRARGGSFRPDRLGATAAVTGLTPLVEKARARAGIDGGDRVARHVSACLANADLPVEHGALEAAILAQGWAPSTEVFNDTFALLRAGLDERRGVAVVCGAGINCAGLLPDGSMVRFAAVGHISGDWGGGGGLWQESMWWAARAVDGRGPRTALSDALPRHAGLATMDDLIAAVHLGTLSEADCMGLTPVLFAVAAEGDEVASALVRRQAEEVVALAVAAMRRLGVLGESIPVVLGGGVLTAGHPQLMDEIDRLLADAAPLAEPRVVRTPPVMGAALLGLDRLGAGRDVRDQLRESFAEVGDAQTS